MTTVKKSCGLIHDVIIILSVIIYSLAYSSKIKHFFQKSGAGDFEIYIYGSFHGTFTTQKFFHMKHFLKCFLSNLNRYVFFYFAVI